LRLAISGVEAFDLDQMLDLDLVVDDPYADQYTAGVVRIETDGDQAELDRLWIAETGDKDRLSEFVLGCNPHLKPMPGCRFQPYYGFGDAILRLTLGENIESGGHNVSSTHLWLMLLNSTIVVDGIALVEDGKLTAAGRGD
jgi:hypothetical protein